VLTGVSKAPDAGTVTISGQAPAVLIESAGVTSQPGAGAIAFAGQAPQILVSSDVIVQPGAGALTISALAPNVVAPTVRSPRGRRFPPRGLDTLRPGTLNTARPTR
jgi:hypothetical protein